MIALLLSGLPASWDPEKKLLLIGTEPGRKAVSPTVRRLAEMKEVLYEPEEGMLRGEDNLARELYFMYRDICISEHEPLFRERGIRYDITVLVPGTVGREYVKTAGHYHPCKPGTTSTYPEVYEVLHGRAHYLLQRTSDPGRPGEGVKEVLVVAAEPGEKVLVPSGFGHVTINHGSDYLVMSNLVADGFASLYEPLREMGGAGYCQLSSTEKGKEGEEPIFVPNPCYPFCPPLRFLRAVDFPDLFLIKEVPQYRAFIGNPEKFVYLTYPEDFSDEFTSYLQALLGRQHRP